MARSEVEAVLANWIEQAISPPGRVPAGTEPASWVAARFAEWWRDRVSEAMGDAERAAVSVREELMRLGGWEAFGDALYELTHLEDALGDLRTALGSLEE